MAKISDDELQRIIERDLPGYKVSQRALSPSPTDADRTRQASDAGTPDLETLRRKYAGSSGGAGAAANPRDDLLGAGNDDDEIVAVEPTQAAHPWDRAARPKAAVISGRNRRVIGTQG
jgi:hypothetical protein